MGKFTIKVSMLANVEVGFEVEASSEEWARDLVLRGQLGKVVSQEIDWDSADMQLVLVGDQWINVEDA